MKLGSQIDVTLKCEVKMTKSRNFHFYDIQIELLSTFTRFATRSQVPSASSCHPKLSHATP